MRLDEETATAEEERDLGGGDVLLGHAPAEQVCEARLEGGLCRIVKLLNGCLQAKIKVDLEDGVVRATRIQWWR